VIEYDVFTESNCLVLGGVTIRFNFEVTAGDIVSHSDIARFSIAVVNEVKSK
jgi:acetyltransferase-like isoleucine patch superfamily enzyme